MAEKTPSASTGLDTPLAARARLLPRFTPNPDAFGHATENFARFMGTPQFLLYMTVFCVLWLGWNTWGPENLRFDSAALGFTALTLMLSLQASYAAPLLLLAQNRQDDRDKVTLQQDRQRAERNLSDTEYLTRELAALRIALRDVATRDFVRSELRSVLEELAEISEGEGRQGRRSKRRVPDTAAGGGQQGQPGQSGPGQQGPPGTAPSGAPRSGPRTRPSGSRVAPVPGSTPGSKSGPPPGSTVTPEGQPHG